MGRASVLVHNLFCMRCVEGLKTELSKVHNITNIHVCLKESSIWFNFVGANDLSTLENQLLHLGFPPKGDLVRSDYRPLCFCKK